MTKNLSVDDSELTACGGLGLFNFNDRDDTSRSFSIVPADGKLMEFKVDAANRDGSAAVHFNEKDATHVSPYDEATELNETEMNWLGAYRYVYVGEHVHAGGAATCASPAICDDCGRPYGNVDPSAHAWGEPAWAWADDGASAMATFTCEHDGSRMQTVDASITSAVKTPATATEKGVTAYTATVSFDGKTYAATKDVVDIPALGVPGGGDAEGSGSGGSDGGLPQTGDGAAAIAAIAGAGIGAMALGLVARRRSRV